MEDYEPFYDLPKNHHIMPTLFHFAAVNVQNRGEADDGVIEKAGGEAADSLKMAGITSAADILREKAIYDKNPSLESAWGQAVDAAERFIEMNGGYMPVKCEIEIRYNDQREIYPSRLLTADEFKAALRSLNLKTWEFAFLTGYPVKRVRQWKREGDPPSVVTLTCALLSMPGAIEKGMAVMEHMSLSSDEAKADRQRREAKREARVQ